MSARANATRASVGAPDGAKEEDFSQKKKTKKIKTSVGSNQVNPFATAPRGPGSIAPNVLA